MTIKDERLSLLSSQGPTFCLAKWLQVTLDLEHGTTHSCHHPKRHLIPLEGLQENPAQLHNTLYKKRMRGFMMEGLRPRECFYCWDLEDINPKALSDRLIKSTDDWAFERLNEVLTAPQKDFSPSYLELMFSSKCNLSCAYCMADVSSKIFQEMNQLGPYPVRQNDHRASELKIISNPNPYQEAFWKWFPQILPSLRYLRLTGGEPFLVDETLKLLNFIEEHPQPVLQLAINSNCSLPWDKIHPYVSKLKSLLENKSLKGIELYASVDTAGEQAEYIRSGLDYKLFLQNIENFKIEIPELQVVIMCTFNVLSFENFPALIKDVETLKAKFENVILDISILKNPEYLRPEILYSTFKNKLSKIKLDQSNFCSHERDKWNNLLTLLEEGQKRADLENLKTDLKSFLKEYDKRLNFEFSKCFPDSALALK